MSFGTIHLIQDDAIATITLNRPEKRNAISSEMIEDLILALQAIETSPARAVIVTGAGRAFCAGMDLEWLQALATQAPQHRVMKGGVLKGGVARASDANLADSRRIARLFKRIYEFPKPLIAAVNGAAVAGGCGIATLCDVTLAAPEAKFGYTEVRVGFIPALVSVYLVRQIGEKRARDLLLTGRIIGADEAQRLGLVTEIVPQEKLLARAREIATEFVTASPTSIACTKRLLLELAKKDLEREIELGLQENARIRSTADFREGLAAFLEKRKPVWH